jgi:hypothetical protein
VSAAKIPHDRPGVLRLAVFAPQLAADGLLARIIDNL